MQNTQQEILETYGKSWSVTERSQRLKLFETCLSDICVYTDPNSQLKGYGELSAYMDEFQKQNPGGGFAATNLISHHDCCLMHWNMVDGQGNAVSKGASFFRFGSDGRLVQMNGFFPLTLGT